MSDDVAKDLMDYFLKSQVDLERYSTDVKKKVISILNKTQKSVIAEIFDAEPTKPLTPWKKQRLTRLTKRIGGILDTDYGEIKKTVGSELKSLSRYIRDDTVMGLNGAVGAELFDVTLTREMLEDLVNNTMVDGRIIGDWWDRKTVNFRDQFGAAMNDAALQVQIGAVRGETVQEMVKRVRGSTTLPGMMKNARREATALVRTSVMQVAHQTRMKLYEANQDLLKGYEWLSTLDVRTTPTCRALDRKRWEFSGNGEGKLEPVGHNFMFSPPPAHWNCFIDGQIPIYTSKGWKKIRDIRVGDLVLTHKGRFRKVTELLFRKSDRPVDVTTFGLVRGNKIQTHLTVTDEHPIKVNGSWLAAKDIYKGDFVNCLAKKCARDGCSNLVLFKSRKYCSLSCKSRNQPPWTEERREKVSKAASRQLLREYADGTRDRFEITKKFREIGKQLVKEGKHPLQQKENRLQFRSEKFCRAASERMKKRNPMRLLSVRDKCAARQRKFYKKHPEKHPNRIMAQKGFISSLERKVQKVLDNIGEEYERQYPVNGFFVDFALPDFNIVIECDGEYWHQDKDRDAQRQKEIENEGWMVLRFGEKQIKDNIDSVEQELRRVLHNHKGKYAFGDFEITTIRKWRTKHKVKLYNFSVEEDESYIAKGFVVHNCRSTVVPWLKSFEDLAGPESKLTKKQLRKLNTVPKGKRASMSYPLGPGGKPVGKQVGPMSYDDWLKTQTADVQIEVLGPRRKELWETNQLSMADMVHQNGRALTIEQLEAKNWVTPDIKAVLKEVEQEVLPYMTKVGGQEIPLPATDGLMYKDLDAKAKGKISSLFGKMKKGLVPSESGMEIKTWKSLATAEQQKILLKYKSKGLDIPKGFNKYVKSLEDVPTAKVAKGKKIVTQKVGGGVYDTPFQMYLDEEYKGVKIYAEVGMDIAGENYKLMKQTVLDAIDESSTAVGPDKIGLKRVRFLASDNPTDAHFANKYKSKGFKAYATGGAGEVNYFGKCTSGNFTDPLLGANRLKTLKEATFHELGHNIGYTLSKPKYSPKKWTEFINAEQWSSTYAKSAKSAAEDFADSFNEYMTSPILFKQKFPLKAKWIEDNVIIKTESKFAKQAYDELLKKSGTWGKNIEKALAEGLDDTWKGYTFAEKEEHLVNQFKLKIKTDLENWTAPSWAGSSYDEAIKAFGTWADDLPIDEQLTKYNQLIKHAEAVNKGATKILKTAMKFPDEDVWQYAIEAAKAGGYSADLAVQGAQDAKHVLTQVEEKIKQLKVDAKSYLADPKTKSMMKFLEEYSPNEYKAIEATLKVGNEVHVAEVMANNSSDYWNKAYNLMEQTKKNYPELMDEIGKLADFKAAGGDIFKEIEVTLANKASVEMALDELAELAKTPYGKQAIDAVDASLDIVSKLESVKSSIQTVEATSQEIIIPETFGIKGVQDSIKAKTYYYWLKTGKTADADEIMEALAQAGVKQPKMSTAKNWLSGWNSGKGLPGGADKIDDFVGVVAKKVEGPPTLSIQEKYFIDDVIKDMELGELPKLSKWLVRNYDEAFETKVMSHLGEEWMEDDVYVAIKKYLDEQKIVGAKKASDIIPINFKNAWDDFVTEIGDLMDAEEILFEALADRLMMEDAEKVVGSFLNWIDAGYTGANSFGLDTTALTHLKKSFQELGSWTGKRAAKKIVKEVVEEVAEKITIPKTFGIKGVQDSAKAKSYYYWVKTGKTANADEVLTALGEAGVGQPKTSTVKSWLGGWKGGKGLPGGANKIDDFITGEGIAEGKVTTVAKGPKKIASTKTQAKTLDTTNYVKYKGQEGSNVGGYYHHKDNPADRWYIKTPANEEMARNEVLASKLYELAGVEVPELRLCKMNNKVSVASRVIDNVAQDADLLLSGNLRAGIYEDMVVDAWLCNWDVVGLSYDNLLVKNGVKAVRIDVGGALRFRAQGGKKGAAFGKKVDELDSLRNPAKKAGTVFKNATQAELEAGARKVIAISDDDIKKLVKEFGPTDAAERTQLEKVLVARKKDIEKRFAAQVKKQKTVKKVKDYGAEVTNEEFAMVQKGRINGYAIRRDLDEIEDQQVLFWTERGADKKDRVGGLLKLRKSGTKKMDKWMAKVATEDGNVISAQGAFDDTYLAMRSIMYQSKKGMVLSEKTLTRVEAALRSLDDLEKEIKAALKAKRCSTEDLADFKVWRKPYDDIFKKVKKEGQDKLVKFDFDENWKGMSQYTTKFRNVRVIPEKAKPGDIIFRRVEGELRAKTIRKGRVVEQEGVLSTRNYYYEADVKGVKVRYWSDKGETDFAWRGRMELYVEGTDAKAAEKIVDALDELGINAARATELDTELMYLKQIAYHMNETDMIDTAMNLWTDTEARITYLKSSLSEKIGKDITKLPEYNPAGAHGAYGTGSIQWKRPDLIGTDWDRFVRDYKIHHNSDSGDIAASVDRVLNSGGRFLVTSDKHRYGQRWRGMSPGSDMGTGGADYFFTRIKKTQTARHSSGYVWKPDVLKRTDSISYSGDKFGKVEEGFVQRNRQTGISAWKSCSGYGSNETIFKRGLSLFEDLDRIVCRSESERQKVIEVFKTHGYRTFPDGRKLEDVIKVGR